MVFPALYPILLLIIQLDSGIRQKSAVVEEVESIRRNRVDRRIKQEEVKVERQRLQSLDPGNPNWEFASMIRYEQYCVYCWIFHAS